MASRRSKSGDVYDPFGDEDRPALDVHDVDRQLFGSMDPTVPLADLRQDGGTQPRASLNEEVVEEYAEAMLSGDRFPPVIVFDDGEHLWLVDGFHRVEASKRINLTKIRAEVKEGSQRDAVLFSLGVNSQHGLRRSNQDKRRAVTAMLLDSEWGKWSVREIARHCHVSPDTVSRRKQEMIEEGSLSDSDSESTYVTKHGTVATMNTTGIADAARQRAQSVVPEPQPNRPAPAPDASADTPVAQQSDAPDPALSGNDYQIDEPEQDGDEQYAAASSPAEPSARAVVLLQNEGLFTMLNDLADQIVLVANELELALRNDDEFSDRERGAIQDIFDYWVGYDAEGQWQSGLVELIREVLENER